MLRAKLVKLASNHSNLRTNEIEGKCTHIPEVGESFVLFAPALEGGDFRMIQTTPVTLCEYNDKKFSFQTKNSSYELLVIDDKDPFEYARVQ